MDGGSRISKEARRVVGVYITTSAIFTLATSIIWGVNTLFLMGAGLDIFQVMLVNTAFTVGQVVFEVPTGVIADTIGRRASFLIGIASLFVATLWYVGADFYGWGFWGFVWASVLIGFGFTCQTGAVDAWLVDALDSVGFAGPKDRVFGWGGATFSAAMIVGTLAGGVLGQFGLQWPYVVRSGLLALCFVVTAPLMRDMGFRPRELRLSSFGKETRTILDASVRYGWRNRVIRPLMLVSLAQGIVFIFAFYSMQPLLLTVIGKQLVWAAAALTAAGSLAGIAGNALVGRIMGTGENRRRPGRVLALASATQVAMLLAIAFVAMATPAGGGVWQTVAFGAAWVVFGFVMGVAMPVRQSFINDHIPSAQRATVLSLDSFFADAGGAVGQPVLGWMSKVLSIPSAWVTGALVSVIGVPLYLLADRGARSSGDVAPLGGSETPGAPEGGA